MSLMDQNGVNLAVMDRRAELIKDCLMALNKLSRYVSEHDKANWPEVNKAILAMWEVERRFLPDE